MEGRPSNQWIDTTYVNLEDKPPTAKYFRPANHLLQNGAYKPPSNFESIAIPRPKYCERRQAQRTFTETYVQDNSTEMIERISDEFRFLEERSNTFPIGSNPIGSYHQKQHKYLFVGLAILQIVVAIGLFVFACVRHYQLFKRSDVRTLLDFVKVEDYVSSNQDGTELIAIKLGTSIFLPALMQLVAGFTALYPLKRRPPKSVYIINIVLCGFAVLFWFRPLVYAVFELNLRNVQLQVNPTSTNSWLLAVALFLFAVDVLVVNSVLLIYANLHLASSLRIPNHVADVHIAMLAVMISFLTAVCSIYTVAHTMTSVSSWKQVQNNIASLYGLGIRELLIACYILFTASFNCASVVARRKNMRQTALTLQILSLLCLFYELLNGDRLLAASHNVRVMLALGTSRPITAEIILILYTFIVVLSVILCIQVVLTTVSVFKAPVYNSYALAGTSIQPITQTHSSF